MSLSVGKLPELRPIDRIILTDVDIVSILRNVQIRAVGNITEGLVS